MDILLYFRPCLFMEGRETFAFVNASSFVFKTIFINIQGAIVGEIPHVLVILVRLSKSSILF